MTKNKLKKVVKLATVFATVLLFVLVSVATYQIIKQNNLKRQIENLNSEIASLQEYKVNLETGIADKSSDIYLEEIARSELGMLKDNESKIEFKE